MGHPPRPEAGDSTKNPKLGPPSGGGGWRWGQSHLSGTLIKFPQPPRTAAEGAGVPRIGVPGEGARGGCGIGGGGEAPRWLRLINASFRPLIAAEVNH